MIKRHKSASKAGSSRLKRTIQSGGGVGLVFAEPIPVHSASECDWYHRFDFPDGSESKGAWDYRHNTDDYLGRLNYADKTVLEIGPASGYLTVAMEQRGATVTSIDNSSEGQIWEYVPRVDIDIDAWLRPSRRHLLRLNKSWWYAQKVFGCSAKIAYCGVAGLRDIVDKLKFDVCFIGGVLQHIRYPLDLLWIASRVATEVVVSERYLPEVEASGRAYARFVPEPANRVVVSWWNLSSTVVTNAMSIFGFDRVDKYKFGCRKWTRKTPESPDEPFQDLDCYSAIFKRRDSL